MERKYLFFFICMTALALLLLPSCNPDGKEVKIQKAEWITRYEDYNVYKDTVGEFNGYVDTLVSYSITEHQTKREYRQNSSGEITGITCYHYITIKNNNQSYSNKFAIKLKGMECPSNSWKDLNKTTEYITINPQSAYTFSVYHPAWWRNERYGYDENNITISILQKPDNVHRTYKYPKRVQQKKSRRIDNLVISDTIVNDCECDIDALKERYNTIIETFERLKQEHLITTD